LPLTSRADLLVPLFTKRMPMCCLSLLCCYVYNIVHRTAVVNHYFQKRSKKIKLAKGPEGPLVFGLED
jgi:hypothetical protein